MLPEFLKAPLKKPIHFALSYDEEIGCFGVKELIADLREASADLGLGLPSPALSELKLAAATTPTLARQYLALHRAYRALDERILRFDETVKMRTEDAPDSLVPYQEVRDFFHYRDNYGVDVDAIVQVGTNLSMVRLAAAAELGLDAPQAWTAHRWRYADTAPGVAPPMAWHAKLALGLCGDWMNEGKVEGAWLSGQELARTMLSSGL